MEHLFSCCRREAAQVRCPFFVNFVLTLFCKIRTLSNDRLNVVTKMYKVGILLTG